MLYSFLYLYSMLYSFILYSFLNSLCYILFIGHQNLFVAKKRKTRFRIQCNFALNNWNWQMGLFWRVCPWLMQIVDFGLHWMLLKAVNSAKSHAFCPVELINVYNKQWGTWKSAKFLRKDIVLPSFSAVSEFCILFLARTIPHCRHSSTPVSSKGSKNLKKPAFFSNLTSKIDFVSSWIKHNY